MLFCCRIWWSHYLGLPVVATCLKQWYRWSTPEMMNERASDCEDGDTSWYGMVLQGTDENCLQFSQGIAGILCLGLRAVWVLGHRGNLLRSGLDLLCVAAGASPKKLIQPLSSPWCSVSVCNCKTCAPTSHSYSMSYLSHKLPWAWPWLLLSAAEPTLVMWLRIVHSGALQVWQRDRRHCSFPLEKVQAWSASQETVKALQSC